MINKKVKSFCDVYIAPSSDKFCSYCGQGNKIKSHGHLYSEGFTPWGTKRNKAKVNDWVWVKYVKQGVLKGK